MNTEYEKIDIVPGTNYKILQNRDSFSYGTDAIFISSFAKPKGVVVDLGTGTGIIPLRIMGKKNIKYIYGIEIQEEVADMAKRSIALNGLEDKIKILNMDLKQLPEKLGKASVDTVITNPPYMKNGGAILNDDENFSISRHEVLCNLEDIIKVSSYLLKPQGKFYMVHRPDRLADIVCTMRQYDIEIKYLRFVQPKINKKPNLLLIEGLKSGKPDLKLHSPLIVYNEDGSYTSEIDKIYFQLEEGV